MYVGSGGGGGCHEARGWKDIIEGTGSTCSYQDRSTCVLRCVGLRDGEVGGSITCAEHMLT